LEVHISIISNITLIGIQLNVLTGPDFRNKLHGKIGCIQERRPLALHATSARVVDFEAGPDKEQESFCA